SFQRPAPGRAEPFAGTLSQRPSIVAHGPELLAQPVRLLEVEADDLVEAAAGLGKPLREALVQLAAQLLRHRLVGGVADEQMPKAKRVVVRERGRAMRPDELLTHEGGQGGDVGAELRERRDPELLAVRRRALGRDALARGKLL